MKKIPICPECKNSNNVEIGVYKNKNDIIAKYYECILCNCVVKKIFDKSH